MRRKVDRENFFSAARHLHRCVSWAAGEIADRACAVENFAERARPGRAVHRGRVGSQSFVVACEETVGALSSAGAGHGAVLYRNASVSGIARSLQSTRMWTRRA